MGPVFYVIELDKEGLCQRHVEQIRKCWSQGKQLQEKRGAEQWELNFPNEGKETRYLFEGEPRQQRDREGQQQDDHHHRMKPKKKDVTLQGYKDLWIDINRERVV